MKLRSTILAISCAALILGGALMWHFIRAQIESRQVAKQAAATRVRAEGGDAEAQFALGSMYSRGKGLPQDYVEAVRWYRKSAEQGYAKGQYGLSYMYHEGKGVPRDHAEAASWCSKAARQGDAKAQDGLGVMYYRGDGVAQDYVEAVRWHRKAAEQGYAEARYNLGYMYYYGYGVRQDRVEANRLFRQAAAQGNEDARRSLGVNGVYVSLTSKIVLSLKFLGSLFFGGAFLNFKGSYRTRARIVTAIAALLLISSFGLDLFWYSYVGHLQSAMAITLLHSARHLLGGAIITMLMSIVHPNSAKPVLIAAVVLFIALVLFQLVLSELRHLPLTIRPLSFAAFPIGMSIPSLIFLWLDTKKTSLKGKGGTTVSLAAE